MTIAPSFVTRGSRRWLPALVMVVFWPAGARDHNLGVDWKHAGDVVRVEAFFSDDTPARQARVQIVDIDKKVRAEATTDDDGKCTLPAPGPGRYRLIVDAGGGHRKEQALVIAGGGAYRPVETPDQNVPDGGGNRKDFTRFPWERVAIGLGVIAAVGGAFWWSRRQRPPLAA